MGKITSILVMQSSTYLSVSAKRTKFFVKLIKNAYY